MPTGLSHAQRESFDANGFLIVEDVIASETLDALWAEYEDRLDEAARALHARGRIQDLHAADAFGERYTKLIAQAPEVFEYLDISYALNETLSETAVMHAGPAVFSVLTDPGLLDVVDSVIGPEIYSNPVQHARIKPPQDALTGEIAELSYVGRTTWHQDMGALTDDAEGSNIVTVWVAVTDAMEENGCLVAIPGSHRIDGGRLRTHCPGGAINAENFSPGRGLSPGERTPLPVRRGGIVLLNRYTEHAALPNRSGSLRFSLDLRYNPIGQATGRPAFPGFVARSRSRPETALRDPARWRQLWLDAAEEIQTGAYQGPIYEAERWKKHSRSPLCA
ncbi:MAG: phytanoyl-CoA dioxygenase family protein [Pseudomonadota bacterium]